MSDIAKLWGFRTNVTGDIFTFTPQKITLNAWKPMYDCKHILFIFQQTELEEDRPEWRFFWISGLAILRPLGHVLKKADSEMTNGHQSIIADWWTNLNYENKDNQIFSDFIEKERNIILKTYHFGAELQALDGQCVMLFEGEDALELYREAVYWWRNQLIRLEERL